MQFLLFLIAYIQATTSVIVMDKGVDFSFPSTTTSASPVTTETLVTTGENIISVNMEAPEEEQGKGKRRGKGNEDDE